MSVNSSLSVTGQDEIGKSENRESSNLINENMNSIQLEPSGVY